ncbi:hypothetical protein N8D56_10200 [Devosia sp. A8/3-2]|nr:hypothetical protein N8D56_10200 [Devosia sp. A8/3-2]
MKWSSCSTPRLSSISALPVIGLQKDLMITAKELFERDYNAFLHFSVAALYFLAVSLVVFFLFGLVYQRLMRHLPAAPRMRFRPKWILLSP